MMNFKQYCLYSCAMALFVPGTVFASEDGIALLGNHLIHHNKLVSLLPEPASDISAVRVAGVYWLPDFLKSNTGRTETCEGANCGNKDPQRTCEKYGYASACASPKEYSSIKSPIPGMTCYQNCHCPSKFQYTTANCKDSEGKMTDGVVCEGKAEKCICKPKVTVGTGEKCDLYCGGNCVKKSCKAKVTVNTGEQCNERCASDTSVCTVKGCKAGKTVGTGEQCDERCASNTSVCTVKSCKPKDNPGTGEECKERCASNSSICTRSGCKASVSVPSGYTCTEYCGSTCVAKGCRNTSGKRTCSCGGTGEVYSCGSYYYSSCYSCCSDSCPSGSQYVSCNSSTQDKVKVATTGCGSACYQCQAKCSNTCSSGSLSRPSGDYKVVGTTDCGNNCYASCSNTCKTGYQLAACSSPYYGQPWATYTNDCGKTCNQCTEWARYRKLYPGENGTGVHSQCEKGSGKCSSGWCSDANKWYGICYGETGCQSARTGEFKKSANRAWGLFYNITGFATKAECEAKRNTFSCATHGAAENGLINPIWRCEPGGTADFW